MQINSEPTRRQLMDQVKQQIDEIERLRDALRWAAPYVKDDPRVSAIIKAALKEGE